MREQIAAQLDRIDYRQRIPASILETAKQHRLVIIHGASDDLMEFRGAVEDEMGAIDGTRALLDKQGLLPRREEIHDDAALEEFFRRRHTAKIIKARWHDEDGYSWTYDTDIPHATFDILEDGSLYCRGIVVALDDLEGNGVVGND